MKINTKNEHNDENLFENTEIVAGNTSANNNGKMYEGARWRADFPAKRDLNSV